MVFTDVLAISPLKLSNLLRATKYFFATAALASRDFARDSRKGSSRSGGGDKIPVTAEGEAGVFTITPNHPFRWIRS